MQSVQFVKPLLRPNALGRFLSQPNMSVTTVAVGSTETKTNYARTAGPNVAFRTSMNAWQLHKYGGVSEIHCNENVSIPTIRNPFQVLVEVCATSVNPLDIAMTSGYGSEFAGPLKTILGEKGLFATEFPLILGRDFSGVVKDKGQLVRNLQIGDEVVGVVGIHEQGAHAQYVTASSCLSVKKPSNLNHVEAASLAYAGLTAWSALKCFGGIQPKTAKRKRVLILGGSGGVGTIAIQLLKTWGADVTTVVNADAVSLVTALGADTIIDYTQAQWEVSLRELNGFDLILNCTRTLSSTFGMDFLKKWSNARYVHLQGALLRNISAYGWPVGLLNSALELGYDNFKGLYNGGATYHWAYVLPIKSGLKALMEMAHQGTLQPVIDKVFPFENAHQAYEKVKVGHARGKTVIDLTDSSLAFASPSDVGTSQMSNKESHMETAK